MFSQPTLQENNRKVVNGVSCHYTYTLYFQDIAYQIYTLSYNQNEEINILNIKFSWVVIEPTTVVFRIA